MGVLTEDSFDYDCCNCGVPASMGREEFMGLYEVGGKIDSDYRCSDCAEKARAEDEAKEFGGYEDLARGLSKLINNGVLSVSASGGYASISCRTPMHDGVAKDYAENLRLQEEREQRIQKVIDSDDDWSASQINDLRSAMRSDDDAAIVKIRDCSDDMSEHNALTSALDAIRSYQNSGNSGKASDTPNLTPKQALDAAIFAAVEQFEEATGLEIGDIDLDREYRHVMFSVITRSLVTR